MLTIAGGIIIAVIALAMLRFVAEIALLLLESFPKTGMVVITCGVILLGWAALAIIEFLFFRNG